MKYPVSNTQLQAIVGGLLGDACIFRIKDKNNGKLYNARLLFNHCLAQEEYLKWKYSLLGDLCNKPVRRVKQTGYGAGSLACRVESRCSPVLNPFYDLFDKPKRVTRKALNLLDPLGLAIWYMDDGTLNIEYYPRADGGYGIRRRRIALATDCFSLKEHYIIQRYFKVVWGIDTKIQKVVYKKRNKESYRLLMNYENAKKFVAIVEPHIHPTMKYKIDFNRERNYHNAEHSNKNDDIVCSPVKAGEVPEMSDPLPSGSLNNSSVVSNS